MKPVWLAAAALLLTCVMVDESAARVVGVGYRNVGVDRGVAFRRGILPESAFQTRGIREAEGLRAVPYRGFVRRPLARAIAWRQGWEGWGGLGRRGWLECPLTLAIAVEWRLFPAIPGSATSGLYVES